MHRKQNFEILGFKSDAAVLTFTFLSLSSPVFSLFVASFFFLNFAGLGRPHFSRKSIEDFRIK